jgi:zinc-ribbon domain
MVDISGITGAAPIWHDVMTAALRGVAPRPFTLPPGMVRETVCQDTASPALKGRTGTALARPSGRVVPALPSCRDPESELFIAGTQPSASSPQPVAAGPVIADPLDGAQFALSSKSSRALEHHPTRGGVRMSCPACGTENPAGNRFCMKCGAAMTAAGPVEARKQRTWPIAATGTDDDPHGLVDGVVRPPATGYRRLRSRRLT